MPPRRQAHYQLTGEFARKQGGEEKDERLRWIREFRDGDGPTASHPRPSVLRTDMGQCLRLLNPSPTRLSPRSASVEGSGIGVAAGVDQAEGQSAQRPRDAADREPAGLGNPHGSAHDEVVTAIEVARSFVEVQIQVLPSLEVDRAGAIRCPRSMV